jgi:hypothetical protein
VAGRGVVAVVGGRVVAKVVGIVVGTEVTAAITLKVFTPIYPLESLKVTS